ncbi:MAG: hypothetical protein ABI210_12350 [Abditibacteriaceae bacterium]
MQRHYYPRRPRAQSVTPKSGAKSTARTGDESQPAMLFGCLLIPQFPIWAARFADVNLSSTPLLIHRKGRVLAACPVALAQGVRVGWTLARAQSLCPAARIKAVDSSEASAVWQEVLSSVYDLTPRIESVRQGLLFFDPAKRGSSSWITTMAGISKLTRQWQISVALASDRATAELAVQVSTTGKIHRIANASAFLQEVPSSLLLELGLSKATTERLQWFGFENVGALKVLLRPQIAAQFANVTSPQDSAILWRFAQAGTAQSDRRVIPQYPLPPMVKSRLVFDQAATCPAEWENALTDVIANVTQLLNGLQTGILTLQFTTQRGNLTASKLLREPLSATSSLYRVAHDLADGLLSENDEVQNIEVRLAQLVAGGAQETLFEPRRFDLSQRDECPRSLRNALRSVEARFSGTMLRWKLKDAYAPLPEERYSRMPMGEVS